jgi:hypothetical protein
MITESDLEYDGLELVHQMSEPVSYIEYSSNQLYKIFISNSCRNRQHHHQALHQTVVRSFSHVKLNSIDSIRRLEYLFED